MNKQLKLIMKIIIRGLESIINILLLPAYYLCGIFHKNKKIWIFCSWFGQRYSDNSRIFYEYINKFHPEIKSVWLSKNKVIIKKLRKEGKIAYHSYSVCGLWNSFRASKIFSTTGGEMIIVETIVAILVCVIFYALILFLSKDDVIYNVLIMKKFLKQDTA